MARTAAVGRVRDWAIPTALLAAHATGAGDRLALALVAGHWNPTTRESHPGARRVAELSGCALSTAQYRLANLVATGDLVVESRGGGKRATRYRVPALERGPSSDRSGPNATNGSDRTWTERENGSDRSDVSSDRKRSRSDRLATEPGPVRSSKGGSRSTRARARARANVGATSSAVAGATSSAAPSPASEPFTDDRGTFLPGTGWVR